MAGAGASGDASRPFEQFAHGLGGLASFALPGLDADDPVLEGCAYGRRFYLLVGNRDNDPGAVRHRRFGRDFLEFGNFGVAFDGRYFDGIRAVDIEGAVAFVSAYVRAALGHSGELQGIARGASVGCLAFRADVHAAVRAWLPGRDVTLYGDGRELLIVRRGGRSARVIPGAPWLDLETEPPTICLPADLNPSTLASAVSGFIDAPVLDDSSSV